MDHELWRRRSILRKLIDEALVKNGPVFRRDDVRGHVMIALADNYGREFKDDDAMKELLDEMLEDLQPIVEVIPHRPNMLLVHRVENVDADGATGYYEVFEDASWAAGHFGITKSYSVMPGVNIVEACAQVGAVALLSAEENQGKIAFFAGIDKVRFKRQVVPGDTLRMKVQITRRRGAIGFGEASAYVGDELVMKGELMFALADPPTGEE